MDAALMADGHVGYVMPIGGVAAYRDKVSVVGVGFDIACGNAAIRTDVTLESLGRTPEKMQRTLEQTRRRDRRHRELRHRPPQSRRRCAGRSSAVRRSRVGRGPAQGARRDCSPRRGSSSVPSAAATTTSTCSPTRRARCGSACTSAAAASGTPSRRRSSRVGQGKEWGERAPEREVLLDLAHPSGTTTGTS